MRGDRIIHTQLLMAQAFGDLADLIDHSRGYVLPELTIAELPPAPVKGTICHVSDSSVLSGVVAGGGANAVLVFWNGFAWKVFAS